MALHNLKPAEGAVKKRKRIGTSTTNAGIPGIERNANTKFKNSA